MVCRWAKPPSQTSYCVTPERLNIKAQVCQYVSLRECNWMRKAIKEGDTTWKESARVFFAFTHAVNQEDIWLSYVLRVTLCDLMTICLEISPQISGPERLDTVWTLRKHQGKPNTGKVKMWNPEQLQMYWRPWCWRADESAEGKEISSSDCFQAAQGEVRSLKIYSHTHIISATGIWGKTLGEKRQIHV